MMPNPLGMSMRKLEGDYKYCDKHGRTLFKFMRNKRQGRIEEYYTCYECLKASWRKASEKKREKNGDYNKIYNKERTRLLKSLSLYLRVLLLAAFMKVE